MLKRYGFSLILILIGLCISLVFYPFKNIISNPLIINPNSSHTLIGRLYRPINAFNNLPVVILLHGVSSSKEMMIPLAIELARNNIAGLAFDLGGFGESYPLKSNEQSIDSLTESTVKDTQAILNYIQNNPQQFNLDKIAIVGHSMGGVTALDLAEKDLPIKATVTLGIGGEATLNSPANLLFAIGTYEQLNPASNLRPLLAMATETPADCFNQQICGNFADGTARNLRISPTTDHFTAIFDSILTQDTIDWIKQSLQITTPFLPPKMPQFIIGILVGVTGLILGLTLFWVAHPNLIRWRCLTGAIALLIILAQFNLISPVITSHAIIILFILILISNYAQVRSHNWAFNLAVIFTYIILLLSAFWVATVFHGLEELIREPSNIIYLPIFAFKWGFYVAYNGFLKFKTLMLPNYSFTVTVNSVFIIVLIIDSLILGIVLTTVEKITMIIVHWLRQPFRLGIKNMSPKEVIILVSLVIIGSIVIWQRYNQGLLNEAISRGGIVGKLFILFILLPIVIIIAVLRSPGLHRLETSLQGWLLSINTK